MSYSAHDETPFGDAVIILTSPKMMARGYVTSINTRCEKPMSPAYHVGGKATSYIAGKQMDSMTINMCGVEYDQNVGHVEMAKTALKILIENAEMNENKDAADQLIPLLTLLEI